MEYENEGMSGGVANESICAEFPDTWEEFVEQNSFEMNAGPVKGSAEAGNRVMDVYRVKQMMWYYLRDYLRLGVALPTDDYEINIVENHTRQGGNPYFRIDRRTERWF